MSQSRTMSAVESVTNVAVGFGVSCLANIVVLPWFGFDVSMGDALGIGFIFTAISLARSYILRRFYNRIGR